MELHPEFATICHRLTKSAKLHKVNLTINAFRFVDPLFSFREDVLSGKGALQVNGRWHLKGFTRVVYLSTDPETALAEAMSSIRYFGFPDSKATPLVLVAVKVKIKGVLNLCLGKVRQRLKFSHSTIVNTDWRADNYSNRESLTQAYGRAAYVTNFSGLLAPSAAPKNGTTIVAFPQQFAGSDELTIKKEVIWPKH